MCIRDRINYVSTEAANRIEYLQTGKVDIILANFTVTPERAQEVDFALPSMNVALGVVSPEDAVITSLDEMCIRDSLECLNDYAEFDDISAGIMPGSMSTTDVYKRQRYTCGSGSRGCPPRRTTSEMSLPAMGIRRAAWRWPFGKSPAAPDRCV